MTYNCIIGIDPGKSGGISVIYKGLERPITHKMPQSIEAIRDLLFEYKDKDPVVFIEKVSMWHGDSSPENRGKQFNIMKMITQYTELKTMIKLAQFDLVEATPGQWMKGLNLKSIKDRTERKNRNKAHAKYFYPGLHVTHATADAVLIMQYGIMRLFGGVLKPAPKAKQDVEQLNLFNNES